MFSSLFLLKVNLPDDRYKTNFVGSKFLDSAIKCKAESCIIYNENPGCDVAIFQNYTTNSKHYVILECQKMNQILG